MYGVEGMEVLGKRLKWLRNKNRYTQKEIAKLIGMTPSGLQKIENDERDPKLDVLIKFCDIYNVSADFLLGRDNTVGELEDLGLNIYLAKVKIDELKKFISESELRLMQIEDEIVRFEDMKTSEISVAVRKKTAEHLKTSIAEEKEELYDMNKQHSLALLMYIEQLLEVPFVKIDKDDIIQDYLPITIDIQPDIFDNFTLTLYGRGVGLIGHYGDYKTEEEAIKNKEDILKRINGSIKQ